MIDAMLTTTVTVKRNVFTKDADGGPIATPVTLYADLPADVQDLGGGEVYYFAQLGIEGTHKVFFNDPQAADIRNGDVIVLDNGRLARVTRPNTRRAHGGIEEFYSIVCKTYEP